MQCANCGTDFHPKRPWGRFCSKRCRWAGRSARRRVQDAKLRDVVRVAAQALGMGPEDFA